MGKLYRFKAYLINKGVIKVKLKRRDIGGKRPRRQRKTKILPFLILISFMVVLLFFYYQFEKSIMPSVLAMAEFKAKTIATAAINDSINETLNEAGITSMDLVTYVSGKDGKITVQVNTILINEIMSKVIKNLDNKFEEIKVYNLSVPLGNLTGSELLANYGPIIDVMIMPIGTATIDYDREFRDTGINQVNHRVWLDIRTEIQIVVPMATKQIFIGQKFVLVDHIWEGQVPPNYITVPKENVLDVAPAKVP